MARLGAALLVLLAGVTLPRASSAGFFVYDFEWTEDVSIGAVATSVPVPAMLTGGAADCCELSGGLFRPNELTFQISVPQTTPVSTITGTSFDVLLRHTLGPAQLDFRVTPNGVSVDGGVPGRQHFAFVGAGGATTPILSIPLNIGAGTTHMFVSEPVPGLTIPVTVWNYAWTQNPVSVTGLSSSPYLGGDGTRTFSVPFPVAVFEVLTPSSIYVGGLVVAPTKIHIGGVNPSTHATFSSFRFEATFPALVPEPGAGLLLVASVAIVGLGLRTKRRS